MKIYIRLYISLMTFPPLGKFWYPDAEGILDVKHRYLHLAKQKEKIPFRIKYHDRNVIN